MVSYMAWNCCFQSSLSIEWLAILSSHVGQELPDSANWRKTMAWWDTCIDAHVVAGAKFLVQPFMVTERIVVSTH